MSNLLLAEDTRDLNRAVTAVLEHSGYEVDSVEDGEQALQHLMEKVYDVVILDIMMPVLDGISVLKEMRMRNILTPVLLLTARAEVDDRVEGLDAGADDYLTKPFAMKELLARVRALSRRKGEVVINEITFADLTLSLATYDLSANGKSIRLGFKEFEVLKLLMSNPKMVIKKEDLIAKVWGYDSEAEDNNVEVYISFLRKKLFFLGSRAEITTLRKVGYKIEEK